MHSIRFIHSSDFHLDRPLGGLAHVPSQLREEFIETPYAAAERVFDIAERDKVDFVVLSGDIVNLDTTGPRAIDFLCRQFQRLEEKSIKVFWIGGQVDDLDLWPVDIPLPKNVHTFSSVRTEEIEFRGKKDRRIATIIGKSFKSGDEVRASDYSVSGSEVARIAVAYGEVDERALQRQSIDYWALGGRHQADDLFRGNSMARYCGSPQGSRPSETGTHTCSLVQIEHGRTHVRTIATDSVRWQTERVDLAGDSDIGELSSAIRDRLRSNLSSDKERLTLVSWLVSCRGALRHDLQQEKVCQKLLSDLTNSHHDGVVSVKLECEPRMISASHYDEETLLGDFLRTVREFETDTDQLVRLTETLPDSEAKRDLVASFSRSTEEERREILREVASLGMDLLAGHDS